MNAIMNIFLRAKQLACRLIWNASPKLYMGLVYFKHRGRLPNFKAPRDLSEIVLSQILSGEIKKYAPYADKLEVRNFIASLGFEKYLPKLYGVWDSPDLVDFSSLPQSFALKTNHAGGRHYICPDKSSLDEAAARATISEAFRFRMGPMEPHYGLIRPKCYAEEYINDGMGRLPVDYKFMCCDGKIKCVLCCVDRDSCLAFITYDLDWNRLEWVRAYERSPKSLPKPENLGEMARIAGEIASHFEQVRVDFYSLPGGRILIGELTFTPEGGFMRYFTNAALLKMGRG